MSDILYIVMPAYNESANIMATLAEWYPIVERLGNHCRLVTVNDGSRDNTLELMQKFAEQHPQFVPLDKANSGHGGTVLYAYRYALQSGADWIFQTDTDGQTRPNEFWQFWEQRHEYDMSIGNRTEREDGFSRIVVTRILRLVIQLRFGVYIPDANTPFRLMSAQSLRENIMLVPDDFNLTNVLLSVIYMKKHQRVCFIPITFRPRQGGNNSINLKNIFAIGKRALKDFKILIIKIDQNISA
ncbi:glycosyltransferase family 2 protein [Bifidobacterium sp. LC6]|uniref:Glycosyltransferase family 2 protein n=1 Tax=Bifidobacterium colobi TaxID=2809026 RepID=A0ABS5UXI3_9BIFI|nr:glycosyltransferase family 2 protein [Bifidobacterium colobi]MBT1175780.1 glycosyltransferase family 2 protein [Bifidobacterium colobi]